VKMNKLHLIFVVILLVDIFWIINYAPPFNSEDMIVLGQTTSFLRDFYASKFNLEKIYHASTQPIIPIIYFVSLLIFPYSKTIYFVNLLVMFCIAYAGFLIAKKLNGKKAGLIAGFIILTTPGIIGFSRIAYSGIVLTLLFLITYYFYLMSDNFSRLKFTIYFTIFLIFCLLAKYSLLVYVISLIIAIISSSLIYKRKINWLYFGISIIITLIIVTPHYLTEKNFFGYNKYIQVFEDRPLITRVVCDTLNYPIMYLSHLVGLIVGVLLILALIKYIVKPTFNQAQIILLSGLVFGVYSYLVPVKNSEVMLMLIPLFTILVSQYVVESGSKIIIFLLILNGLFFITPLSVPDRMNGFSPINLINAVIDCNNPYTIYVVNQKSLFVNKNPPLAKSGLFDFKQAGNDVVCMTKLVMSANPTKVLDLTGDNFFEIAYYAAIFNPNHEFRYYRCRDIVEHSYYRTLDVDSLVKEFDFVFMSNITAAQTSKNCRNCLPDNIIQRCDAIRDYVKIYVPIGTFNVSERPYPYLAVYSNFTID